ncbi:hypothetical protein RB213_015717 [Colletotrichum asianum]
MILTTDDRMMDDLAQLEQPPRATARAQRWRHHQDDREPDRTGDGWNLAVMSHIQRRQRETTLLNVIKDLSGLLWTRDRRRPELLPSFAQDAFGGIPEMAFANRFLGPSNPALQRPLLPPSPLPLRAEEPFRERQPEMSESSPKDDTASQPQTAGVRRRNGQAEDTAHDSAETTATNTTGVPGKPMEIKFIFPNKPEKADPDATTWDEINASLKPMVDSLDKDSSCLLLCSGHPDFCRISPVSLSNDKGSVDHWESMRREASSLRGRWRWLPWVGKPRLDLVEIRALGLHPSDPGDLCGLYEVVDLGARIRDLKDKANTYGPIAYNSGCSDYSDHYICTRCWYDADAPGPTHGYFCDGFRTDAYADGYEYIDCFEEMYCGMEEQLGRLEEISKLEAAAMWSATLDNPILAAGNSLFPAGLVKSPKFVTSSQPFSLPT